MRPYHAALADTLAEPPTLADNTLADNTLARSSQVSPSCPNGQRRNH
jgi:hypothetical protein